MYKIMYRLKTIRHTRAWTTYLRGIHTLDDAKRLIEDFFENHGSIYECKIEDDN